MAGGFAVQRICLPHESPRASLQVLPRGLVHPLTTPSCDDVWQPYDMSPGEKAPDRLPWSSREPSEPQLAGGYIIASAISASASRSGRLPPLGPDRQPTTR